MGKYNATGIKRTVLIVLCCVLAVALAALLVIIIVTNHLLDQVQRPEDTTLSSSVIEEILDANTTSETTLPTEDTGSDPTETLDATDVTETIGDTQPTAETQTKARTNILLIGHIANSSESWHDAKVMILCTLDEAEKTLRMSSYQKNAVVNIPGYGENKLCTAYSIGGMKLLDQCLAEEYGVQVDANIAVNVEGLMDLVDMLGGVTLELTAQEADYLNAHGNWGITSMGGWSLKAGENTLSGEEAMGYAMISKLGGEVGRIQRQRKVVAAMVEQAEKLSITQMYDLVENLLGCVSTDMTNSEILSYIAEFAPLLAELQIIT